MSESDPSRSVGIIQSNYIPWRGYFDFINSVDEFIFLEDVQYTKRDWRNRNRIKTATGVRWLTIPVTLENGRSSRIDEVKTAYPEWADEHLKTLHHAYARAPYFDSYFPLLAQVYRSLTTSLSEINRSLISAICELLGITTRLSVSSSYPHTGTGDARLVSLCQAAGATHYLSGPTARHRLDEGAFAAAGVSVSYMEYSGYPVYEQVHPPFEPAVSILDLLLCTGPTAPKYMRTLP
jgi:hypothetical protein